MSRGKSILALAAAASLAGSVSDASVIPAATSVFQWTTVPHTAEQLADDPNLANYCTWNFQVVVSSATAQDRFASADIRMNIGPIGKFYIPPSNDSNSLQIPSVRNTIGQRYLQVDTMVNVPIFNATRTTVLGKSAFAPFTQVGAVFPSNGSNFHVGDPNGTTFEPANDMTMIDVAWGDINALNQPAASDGTFTIGLLTISKNWLPYFGSGYMLGRLGSTGNPSNPTSFTIFFFGPDPASVAIMAAGLGALALRRTKR